MQLEKEQELATKNQIEQDVEFGDLSNEQLDELINDSEKLIDAADKEFIRESVEKSLSDSDEPKPEPQAEEGKTTLAEDKTAAEGESPSNAQVNAQKDETGLIIIDDKYLASVNERDRKILTAIKGDKMTPRVLKNYLNSQYLIQKDLSGQLYKPKQGEQNDVRLPESDTKLQREAEPTFQQKPSQELPADLKAAEEEIVFDKLRAKFPDLPTDPEEMKLYRKDLVLEDPDQFYELKEAEIQIRQQVKRDLQQIVELQNNYQSVNAQIIQQEMNKIKTELQDMGLTPEALGYEFDPEKSEDFINELLTDKQGNIDPSVVQIGRGYLKGIDIIQPDALVNKFFRTQMKRINQYIANKSKNEGFKEAQQRKAEMPKSMMAGGGGAAFKPINLDAAKLDELGDEQLNYHIKEYESKLN